MSDVFTSDNMENILCIFSIVLFTIESSKCFIFKWLAHKNFKRKMIFFVLLANMECCYQSVKILEEMIHSKCHRYRRHRSPTRPNQRGKLKNPRWRLKRAKSSSDLSNLGKYGRFLALIVGNRQQICPLFWFY